MTKFDVVYSESNGYITLRLDRNLTVFTVYVTLHNKNHLATI